MFNVMLAKTYAPERVDSWKYVFAEPKLDGIRICILFNAKKDSITYYSRNGNELLMFTHLNREVHKFVRRAVKHDSRFANGAFLDGEMVSKTGNFGDISGAIHRKDHVAEYARFACFHAMPIELWTGIASAEDDTSQYQRSNAVQEIVQRCNLELIQHHRGIRVGSHEQVMEAYAKHRKDGVEGTMVKDYSVPWIGKRTYAWMKLKAEETEDVVVTGVKKGTGKYARSLGALLVDFKGKECRVSGMTDADRNRWWKNPKSIIGKTIEVNFQEATVNGKLRHPRFVRLREDK